MSDGTEFAVSEEYIKTGTLNLKGFRNLGNTCYMNSTLQALLSSSILTSRIINLLLKDDTKDELEKANPLLKSYVQIIAELLGNNSPSNKYSPGDFKHVLSSENEFFRGSRQHDSHELLLYMLNDFVEDHDKTMQENMKREDMSELSNCIFDTYFGKYTTYVCCKECKYKKNHRTSRYSNILLPIPRNKRNVTLEDCFGEYSKYVDDGENTEIKCKKCKKITKNVIYDELETVPDVVVMTLNRFNGMRKNTSNVKINETIRLDGKLLTLTATINHYGSLGGGHYTANVARYIMEDGVINKRWMKADDSSISNIDINNKLNDPSIYLMIYEAAEQL